MDEFPTAGDMWKQTVEASKNNVINLTFDTMKRLFVVIREKSQNGEHELYTREFLSADVQKVLKSKGYDISGENGACCEDTSWTPSWTISWKIKAKGSKKRKKEIWLG